jgi:hypothetical protein
VEIERWGRGVILVGALLVGAVLIYKAERPTTGASVSPTPTVTASTPLVEKTAPMPIPVWEVHPPTRTPTVGLSLPAAALPTELPDTAGINAWLEARPHLPAPRQVTEYLLGLNAHLEACLGGSISKGEIDYWLHFDVNLQTETATARSYESTDAHGLSEEQVKRFGACAEGFFRTHDLDLPGYNNVEFHWSRATFFPIRDEWVYKVIASDGAWKP